MFAAAADHSEQTERGPHIREQRNSATGFVSIRAKAAPEISSQSFLLGLLAVLLTGRLTRRTGATEV